MKTSATYLLFYKPHGVLSQFSPSPGKKSLKDFGPFPPDVYPVGRLDADSEGSLLLTNDNGLRHRLTDPKFHHPRTYHVQVERVPDTLSLERLRSGVVIEGKKTKPAVVSLLANNPGHPPRPTPIRFRKNVPTAWLAMTLSEGRNRQIRKMTAAVGHPTLRLIRVKIGALSLEGIKPGEWKQLKTADVARLISK